jgi:hypothetical protein
MGVRAQHGGHPPIEVPSHRDLLAGCLGVHVDEDVVGLAAQLEQQRVGLGEGRAACVHEDIARKADHRQADAVARRDRVAVAGLPSQVVGGAQDPRFLVEVGVNLAVAIGMVAKRDHVHAGCEQVVGEFGRDPEAAGDVLAVHHHERGVVALAKGWQRAQECAPPSRADEIAAEQDSRGR